MTSIKRSRRSPKEEGSITMIMGPMFSGKTTELLRLHDRQMIAKKSCVLVKYAGDTRYDVDLVATHTRVKGTGLTVKAHHLRDVRDALFGDDVQVVSIDEGQFFDDLADTCEELATAGKIVTVAVLNGTFERIPFPQVSKLIPYAIIKQLTAICADCGSDDAIHSFRSSTEKKVEVIGGEEAYKALCRRCYNANNKARQEIAICEERSSVENRPECVESGNLQGKDVRAAIARRPNIIVN